MAIGAGLAGIAWAVRSAGDADLGESTHLVTTGPYALSRNPMSLEWTSLYVGVALLADALWLLLLLPLVLARTHLVVRDEERALAATFGEEFARYRRRVPRYLGVPARQQLLR